MDLGSRWCYYQFHVRREGNEAGGGLSFWHVPLCKASHLLPPTAEQYWDPHSPWGRWRQWAGPRATPSPTWAHPTCSIGGVPAKVGFACVWIFYTLHHAGLLQAHPGSCLELWFLLPRWLIPQCVSHHGFGDTFAPRPFSSDLCFHPGPVPVLRLWTVFWAAFVIYCIIHF